MKPTPRVIAVALFIAALGIAGSAPARADMWFEPAFKKEPLKGPAAARGVFIWSHGNNGDEWEDAAASSVPLFVALLQQQGWDVFLFERTYHEIGAPNPQAEALDAQVARFKADGYHDIVLGGQSQGAWVSLIAAGDRTDIHAVIANAPATFGVEHPRYTMNATELYRLLGAIRTGRIMVSYFRNDPFDPGGRGPQTDEILSRNSVPHLIVDQPPQIEGHSGAYGGIFYRRFVPCILAVAGDDPMPGLADCATHWGEAPSADVPLPPQLSFASDVAGLAGRFIGRWWGTYAIGREVMLAVTNIAGTKVDAVYAVGPSASGKDKATYEPRVGLVDGDSLVFLTQKLPTLRYEMTLDGHLHGAWVAPDGRSTLTTLLQKLPP